MNNKGKRGFRTSQAPIAYPDSLVGIVIEGKYELLSAISSGGWSVIFKAKHVTLNTFFAVKVLHPHLMDDEDKIRRFEQEAQAASRLNHPNVIRVIDYGVLESGQHYLVMDYLEGEDLSEILKREGALEPERAVDIFAQACNGLAAAHAKGIVHRDLKPSNLMIVKSDSKDCVKIVDFGIAKLTVDVDEMTPEQLTRTGETIGTPWYMSPEQSLGRKLDRRSDIYSLGCVMYHALTGVQPFVGGQALEVMHQQVNEVARSFSDVAPERKIPARLEEIVFKALAKDPAKRYQTATTMKDDLDFVASGDKSIWQETLPGKFGRINRHLKRNSKMILSSIAGVVILALAVWGYQNFAVPMQLESACKTALESGETALKAENFAAAQESFEKALAKADKLQNTNLQISALRSLVVCHEGQGNWEKAELHRRRIGSIQAKLEQSQLAFDPRGASHASDLTSLVNAQLNSAPTTIDPAQKPSYYEEWIARLESTAFLCLKDGRAEDAEKLMRKALFLQDNALKKESMNLASNYMNLGVALAQQQKYEESRPYFEKGLAVARRHPGEYATVLINALCNMGRLSMLVNDLQTSDKYYKEGLKVAQSQPRFSLASAILLNDYAILCRKLGRKDEADYYHQTARAMRAQLEGKGG